MVIKVIATAGAIQPARCAREEGSHSIEAIHRGHCSEAVTAGNKVSDHFGGRVPNGHDTERKVVHWKLAVGLLPVEYVYLVCVCVSTHSVSR